MKLVICNGWSDLNAGDSAIIMGIIKRFQIENPNIEVSILSELSDKNGYYDKSIEKLKQEFPNTKINLVPSPFYKKYDNSIISKIREIISFLWIMLLFKFNILNNQYTHTIENADIVISKGGHFIFDRKGIKGTVHLMKCLFPMQISKRKNKPFSILGQSMGPFYTNTIIDKINLKFSLDILNYAESISFREDISKTKMLELGLKESKINVTSDYAFLLDNKNISPRQIDKAYIVVTLRQHKFANPEGESQYLSVIKDACLLLHDKYGISILVVPHVKGPNDFENDIIITEKFEKIVKGHDEFIFDYNYYSASQLISLYANSDLILGTRFHSVIFGLISNVPAFAISYSGYKANIVKQFGLDQYMMDIENISQNSELFLQLLEDLYLNKEHFSDQIKNNMVNVKNNIISDSAFNHLSRDY